MSLRDFCVIEAERLGPTDIARVACVALDLSLDLIEHDLFLEDHPRARIGSVCGDPAEPDTQRQSVDAGLEPVTARIREIIDGVLTALGRDDPLLSVHAQFSACSASGITEVTKPGTPVYLVARATNMVCAGLVSGNLMPGMEAALAAAVVASESTGLTRSESEIKVCSLVRAVMPAGR